MQYDLQVTELASTIKRPARKIEDEVAKLILDEISWQISFSKSQDILANLANEALVEYNSGKTK